MYGKLMASRPNLPAGLPAAPAPAAPSPEAPAPPGLPGDLTSSLIQEWAPLLKPTGIGLLVALHSFEERLPGHPHFGWAHCTQTALAAYLDTSQDTIARYSNLLQTCGLVQVEEVETPRGKQKLYRVARGRPLPSLALLEHLVFDADTWTRKHTAWLTAPLAPLGPETELTRLTAIMGRAYRVQIDSRGLATLAGGERLTRPGSYRPRRAPEAHQPGLLPVEAPPPDPRSALSGQPAPVANHPVAAGVSAPGGLPQQSTVKIAPADSAPGGLVDPAHRDSTPNRLVSTPSTPTTVIKESAPGGLLMENPGESARCGLPVPLQPALDPPEESASNGLGADPPLNRRAVRVPAAEESAESGVGSNGDSAPGGLAPALNVNVESINVTSIKNDNDNDPQAGALEDSPAPADDPEALVRWGRAVLGDRAGLEWHRRCLAEHGAARYCWAIEATQRAKARGPVGKPGAYFTSLLRRGGAGPGLADLPVPAAEPPSVPAVPARPAAPPAPALEGPAPVAGPPVSPTALDEPTCARIWQTALVHLHASLPADDCNRILRYAVLLELDPATGWALLGLPAAYLREQIAGRLAGQIGAALSQVCGATVRVAAAVLPGQGRLAGTMPTLGALLAQQRAPEPP